MLIFMRIGIAVDYGKYANASSLNLIARKIFLELGKLMNETRTFTISAIKYEDIGIGDVNDHFDVICVPNMGGYRFPHPRALSSKNLLVGLVGIDEVILGKNVFKTEEEWKINKPIIEREVPKWEKYVDKIKFVHVSTNSEKEQMIKYLRIPENKISIIPLGVDHKIFSPPENKEKTRKQILGKFFHLDFSYFIHVSEANYVRKNVFRMLEAFENARANGVEQNLIIVGKTDSVVFDKAKKIPGVILTNYIAEEDLVMFIQGADAMIFPSLHEGFGLPPLEAMACGVPVVTSNVYSLPEVVGDGGLYVDPYNISDIANKIVEISKNQTLREDLARKALKNSMDYSWGKTAKMLLNLIKKCPNNDFKNFDFKECLDLAAYRTLTTVCEITPDLMNTARNDLREANYSRIIHWALEVGLECSNIEDFLIPFKEWLYDHS